ncbi:hypothetical protein [Paraburkholderia fungorum]
MDKCSPSIFMVWWYQEEKEEKEEKHITEKWTTPGGRPNAAG